MENRKGKTWLALLAVLAVAALIFFFSSQDARASSALSSGVTRAILSVLVPGFRDMTAKEQLAYLQKWSLTVRKVAHFTEYALLALTLVNYLRLQSRIRGRGLRIVALLAWIAAAVYACTDELHQLFVGGRAGMIVDVLIDAAGALTGALIGLMILKLRNRRGCSEQE